MTWPVHLSKASKFRVVAEYKPFKRANKFIVAVGKNKVSATTKSGGKNFILHDLGTMNLSAGNQVIKIQADGVPKGDLMEFRSLHLTPVPQIYTSENPGAPF